MSMISGQVDRLRTAAQTYRRLGNHSAESMLLDAADTIWKLRDDLQRANAENAKLREQVDAAHMSRLLTENENESLRELVRDMWEGYNDPRCEECHLKDTPTCADCPICAREASVIDRMRELGVDE